MTISECIKANGWQCEVRSLKRWQNVDISFINSTGHEDETEFSITTACTTAGVNELTELFSCFCKENGFATNTVFAVTVVNSAESEDELC